jgi:hypothetical protein
MPAYLIVHNERRGEDDTLTVELTPDWAIFKDEAGACFAVPREQIRSVMRVDAPQDGPALEKGGT